MAWLIAVVVDPTYDISALDGLTRQMPVCAVSTPEREQAAAQVRADSEALWAPEPSFTLVPPVNGYDAEANCLAILDTIESYHPGVSAVELIGIGSSDSLTAALSERGYQPATGGNSGIRFKRKVESISGVKDLVLNASNWKTADDVYDAFFQAVGAPSWHGRNFDALSDSIITGGVNQIEVPYRLIIKNYDRAGEGAREMIQKLALLIRKFAEQGCPVTIQFEEAV